MNVIVCLTLILLAGQPAPGPAGLDAATRPVRWVAPANRHWCEQPAHKLRWLNQMIQNAQSWPPYHYGWEVHQARYQGREVFILHLCRYCGQQRGFLLYNHYGDLIEQGEGVDSVRFTDLTADRLLATHAGRFRIKR